MTDLKPWYQSRAVWGALVAIAASVMRSAGLGLPEGAEGEIADAALSLAGTAGGLAALYGRIVATRPIGG